MARTGRHSGVHRLAVVGVGLMGGSLGLAAQARARVDQVVGFDRDPTALEQALRLGAITEMAASPEEAAAYADLVVVAAPVREIPGLVEQCAAAQPPPRLISDTGSTKSGILDGLSPAARCLFVGGHPMCGAESSGVRYARADLFDGANYFLCTTGAAFPKLYEMLQQFVLELGAHPTLIDPCTHDCVMAVISHLPHVLANVLIQHAGGYEAGGKSALHWVGPSFKDLTRIAGANPAMWRDIFLENRGALAASLRSVASELEEFSTLLEQADEGRLTTTLQDAAALRRELLEAEDLEARTLYRVTVRIPDQPGTLTRVMTALSEAHINIEDLTLHHMSRSVGGDLLLFVDGEDTAVEVSDLVQGLGYPAAVSFNEDLAD